MTERLKNVLFLMAILEVVHLFLKAFLETGYPEDLGSFLASGHALANGVNPYSGHAVAEFAAVNPGWVPVPNLNPPTLLPLFRAMSALPFQLVNLSWWLSSCIIIAGVIVIHGLRGKTPKEYLTLIVLWDPIWKTIGIGQIYQLPLLFVSIAVIAQSKQKWVVAGVCIGAICAVKPNFAVWILLLFLAGHYRIAISAVVTSVTLWMSAVWLFGARVFGDWFSVLDAELPSAIDYAGNASLPGILVRLGLPYEWTPGLGLFVAVGLAAIWAIKRKREASAVTDVAVLTSIFAAPIGWSSYLLLYIPILLEKKTWSPATLAASMLLCIPSVLIQMRMPSLWWIFPLILALFFVDRLREDW